MARRRGDSFPRIMALGGFFFEFEPFRTASRRLRGATGETSRTAPASGHRRLYVAVVRPPTPARHRRAPRRLEPPRGPRAVSRRPRTGVVGVVAVRSVRTASRGSERSTSTPSARRVRRRATPGLCWLQRHAVGSDYLSVAPNATILPATKHSPAGDSGLRSAVTCTDFVPGPSINSLLTSTSATSLRSCTSGTGDSKAFAPPAVNAPSQQRPGSPAAGQAGSVATCLAGTSREALTSPCRPMSSAFKAEQASQLLHDTLLSLPRSSDALLQVSHSEESG